MAITGSVFSLKDVVNVFDEDIRPSSLQQARTLSFQPFTKSRLSSFSGSSDPFILTFNIVQSPETGSSAVGTSVTPVDDAIAVVQYRSVSNIDVFYTSSTVNLSPSSSNIFIDLPDITGSFSDYEYRLIVLNGFNNDTSILQSWQESGSNFVAVPSVQLSPIVAVTASAYSTPDLFTEFVETNTQNLDLIEVESFISLYHSCPARFSEVDKKKRDFDPLYVKVYIPKGQTFANADYFFISSSLAGNLLTHELELRLGVGYYIKEKDPEKNDLRYVQHKFKPKPTTVNGEVNPDKYFILEPKSSTFNCSDTRIRYVPCKDNIQPFYLVSSFPYTINKPSLVIHDGINSRIDSLNPSTPEFILPRVQDTTSYNLTLPKSGLTYLYPTKPPSSLNDLGLYFTSFRSAISGSLSNSPTPSCEFVNRYVSSTLNPAQTLKEVGIRNDPNYRLKTIPLHERHFTGSISEPGSGRFNNQLIPYNYPNPFFNGIEIFNYSTVSSLYFGYAYSYHSLNYPISFVEGFIYESSGAYQDGVYVGDNINTFCSKPTLTGSVTSLNSDLVPFNCRECSQVTEVINPKQRKEHKVFLGVYPWFENIQRTEGKILDGGTPISRCVSASSLTKDPSGLITASYFGAFCEASEFEYNPIDLKEGLKGNSIYVLQITGSFLNTNKDEAKLVYVQTVPNKYLLKVIGQCGSCQSLPQHPFGPEKFDILYTERYTEDVSIKLSNVPYTSQIQLIHTGSDCCRQVDEIQLLERDIVDNQSNVNPRYVP